MNSNFNSLLDHIKMVYFMNFREMTNYQNFFIIIAIGFITILTSIDNFNEIFSYYYNYLCNILNFNQKKSIILEGRHCFRYNQYSSKSDNIFSNRFEAFWYFITSKNLNNPEIFQIKEYIESLVDDDFDKKTIKNNNNYIIDQYLPFKINKDIYCRVSKHNESSDEKSKAIVEKIIVEIYTFSKSLSYLNEFLTDLEEQYKNNIDKKRREKKFIWTYNNENLNSGNEEYYSNRNRNFKGNNWEECEFNSSRNFSNLFFEEKKSLIKKINFFNENKDWYNYEGHPWTLGIGLHGPPGTGKTSVIKCIANKLNRHIIVIPLSKIKTQTEFSACFFEQYYSRHNFHEVGFEEKIIVFEDIDCMSDIVKKRQSKSELCDKSDDSGSEFETNIVDKNTILQNKLLNKIAKSVDNEHDDINYINLDKSKKDQITLSYILNTIDGIRETPGRIIIITSNNYDQLDPALIRPGRIDITLNMKNASIDIIKEMYNHYYKDILPKDIETKITNYKISPAKLVNIRLENHNREDFLQALEKEFN